MEQKTAVEKSLFIKTGPTIKRVVSTDILYIQCDGNVSHVYMRDGSEHVCVRLLKLFEQDLEGAGFIRINHNVLVNLAEILEIRYVNARKRQVILTGVSSWTCLTASGSLSRRRCLVRINPGPK